MKCLEPIVLNSGLVVPCGKCELCRSAARSDWSVRLQLHSAQYQNMPLFVTLTYNEDNLVYADDVPTLCKSDIRGFIKRYRDGMNLYNTDWSFFGCGEYGDSFGRPHYHLLLFGDNQLFDAFQKGQYLAEEIVTKYWQKGFVKVVIADWSGIHYVTKYVMKHVSEGDASDFVSPFTLCSKGIAANWLRSPEAKRLKSRINNFVLNHESIYSRCVKPLSRLEDSLNEQIFTLHDILHELDRYVPKLVCQLPSLKTALLPRYLRRKLIGSFEYFKDNPFWCYNSLSSLCESMEYYRDHYGYDLEHDIPYSSEVSMTIRNKILKRYVENKHKKSMKR